MRRSIAMVRDASWRAVLLPFVLAVGACSVDLRGTGSVRDAAVRDDVASFAGDGSDETSSVDSAPDVATDSDASTDVEDGPPATDDAESPDGELPDEGLGGETLVSQDSESDVGVVFARGPLPVLLRTAGNYAILAKTTVTNDPPSLITGDLGLSPGKAAAFTGFDMTRAGTSWTSTQVLGKLFAADSDVPTPAGLIVAVGDMETAYTDAAGRPTPGFTDLAGGALGGRILTPGLYRWNSAVTIATDLTISGGAEDTWIFQITGAFTMAASTSMKLTGGAQAKNIVWQTAGAVGLGAGAHVEGIFLAKTAINLAAGASVNGRLLAQTAVTLATNTISAR